ncbi:mepce protein [Capsaspora owczarzaki ATCC 30864]|uniref:RNA methyltransferase n=1 Tax=Capsaspora owczarzaki (strain ATCC 30864) TaxID=595528 RepID=A0A0D2X351_CAPO3|nr:mepce protein [Capsaspora owczarzaki ATCC 30864]KJE93699.1 mepce protein [Capsaspora owczarzaki ATCC 30864]|eukprot:XP_004348281.2 mepce protein [Capsaspora owczarzaki ATCC 30864]
MADEEDSDQESPLNPSNPAAAAQQRKSKKRRGHRGRGGRATVKRERLDEDSPHAAGEIEPSSGGREVASADDDRRHEDQEATANETPDTPSLACGESTATKSTISDVTQSNATTMRVAVVGKAIQAKASSEAAANHRSLPPATSMPASASGYNQGSESHSHAREVFPYGNYREYYGYRTPHHTQDPRLQAIPTDCLAGKAVLDIGCNSGLLSLELVRRTRPSRFVGVDIDEKLIAAAIRHREWLKSTAALSVVPSTQTAQTSARRPVNFPISLAMSHGALTGKLHDMLQTLKHKQQHSTGRHRKSAAHEQETNPLAAVELDPIFDSVEFYPGNVVDDQGQLPMLAANRFDTVLCLSVTKWIHLNWGDEGLRDLFARICTWLRPQGVLILEPQPWKSYHKASKTSDAAKNHYQTIQLRPEDFPSLLEQAGFTVTVLAQPDSPAGQGFARTLYSCRKKQPT